MREAVCKYLQLFNSCHDQPRTIKQIRRRRWQPPKPCEYKINFDGAMFSEEDEAGLGIVVWDSAGQVLASLAEKNQKTTFSGVLGDDSSEMGCDFRKGNWIAAVPF
uniref:RNase H type-1 domain-containing protein n=1 Tax=Quercus lobata TaxID=97700 RepID=A0A7N2KXI1_QUELO